MTTYALPSRPSTYEAPAVQPLTSQLLDIATISEGIDYLEPSGLFESYNCLATDNKAIWPCPPNLLAAPVMTTSSTATTGGTLAAGTYRAVLTAINERGETTASNELTQVTTGSTSTITWNWNDLSGETGYRLYITDVNGASGTETFVIQLAANTTSYVWTGTPANNDVTRPPTTNTAVVSVSKTFAGPSWQDGIRFGVYAGVVCKYTSDMDYAIEAAQRVFLARESVGVERALMQTRFIAGSGWSAATDLTPAGGAVNPEVGLALLEGDAGCKYAGLPTIHAPRTVASLLTRSDSASMDGGVLRSGLGSYIAAGAGYQCPNNSPTNTAPAAGEFWMYASGGVTVARSDLIVGHDKNRSTNEDIILVERAYVAAVDCYTAAVRVKVQ